MKYDETSHEWKSVDWNNKSHKIKNPFEQVTNNKHSLRNQLLEQSASPLLRVRCKSCSFGQGVIFPDISEEDANNIADRLMMNRDLVLGCQSVHPDTIQNAIDRVFNRCRRSSDKPLGLDAIIEFVNKYASSWSVRPLLFNSFKREREQLAELTEQQFKLLRYLNNHKRVAIHGFAGSGKTFLALEKARRLARLGMTVLFTCFNRGLADSLQRQISEESRIEVALGTIQVFSIHALARDFCRKLQIWPPRNYGQSEYQFYVDELVNAAKCVRLRYDAIIVDEAQDFEDRWWEGLQLLLRSEESSFYIFYDDNQNIYSRTSSYPVPPAQHYSLLENCRTTKKIHEEIIKYYATENESTPICEGPEGRQIERISIPYNGDALAELGKVLKRFDTESIPLKDVVLLTPSSKEKSLYRDNLLIDNQFRLSWNVNSTPRQNTLICHSIHRFKGLESDVVILVELDKAERMPEQEKVLYVALSRARLHLIILEDKWAKGRLLPDYPSFLPDYPEDVL